MAGAPTGSPSATRCARPAAAAGPELVAADRTPVGDRMLIEMPVSSASSATVPALLSQVPCLLPWAFWVRAVHGGVPRVKVLGAKRRLVDPAGSPLPGNRPASDTRQRDTARPVVVLHHLRPARSDGRVHDLVQVGEFHLHPVDDRHDSILTDKTALAVCPGGGHGRSPGEPAEPGWLPGLVADDFRVLVTSGGVGQRRHSAATGSVARLGCAAHPRLVLGPWVARPGEPAARHPAEQLDGSRQRTYTLWGHARSSSATSVWLVVMVRDLALICGGTGR